MSAGFTVQRQGDECVDCGQALEPGQRATYVGRRDLAHITCPPKPKACERCWLVHPGECA